MTFRSSVERRVGIVLADPRWMVVVVAALVFGNTFANLPVLDDGWVIFENPLIKNLGNIPRLFCEPYNAAMVGNNAGLYRPVTMLTYALNYAAGGADVVGYHAVNIALHALCSLAVFALARLVLGSPAGALVAALLFAVHPVHVEAVASIVGRAELLAALGSLTCLYLTCTRDRARWRFPAALVALALGVLSKENAAVTPLLWCLLALAAPAAAGLEARPGVSSAEGKRALVRMVAAAGAMACAVAVYLVLRPGHGPSGASLWFDGQPRSVVFDTMTRAIAEYLRLLVFPHPLGVDFYYANRIPLTTSFTAASAAATAIWAAVLLLAIVLLRRAPSFGLGILWVFVALLPVSNVVPIGVLMAERLLYLPSVGFCIAAGAGAAWLFEQTQARWAVPALAIVLLALGAKTWTRNAEWRDALTLWEAELRKAPQDVVVNNNLAVEYTARGELTRARERLEVASRTNPAYWRAHVNLAIVEHKLGDDDAAARALELAHRLAPAAASPDFFLAQVLADQGDLSRAVEYLALAEAAEPLDANAPLFRGWYLLRLGRLDEATAELSRAAALDPGNPQPKKYLADIARGNDPALSATVR